MKITDLLQIEVKKFVFLVIIYILYPAMDIVAALQLATSVDRLIEGNVLSFINYLIIAMFFNIYAKLGAKNLVEAYNTAMELGYIKPIM